MNSFSHFKCPIHGYDRFILALFHFIFHLNSPRSFSSFFYLFFFPTLRFYYPILSVRLHFLAAAYFALCISSLIAETRQSTIL